MAAIAEWGCTRLLAVAQTHGAAFRKDEFFRSQPCAGMFTITHGLVAAESAGTPEILPRFEIQDGRLEGVDFRQHGGAGAELTLEDYFIP